MAKQDDYARYTIRVPRDVYSSLEEQAERGGRSLNAEIVARLALSVEDNIWERQKFIDTINFKQHIIDKQIHYLVHAHSENNEMKNALKYEKSLRISQENTLFSLCNSIINSKCDENIKKIAHSIISNPIEPASITDAQMLKSKLEREIGDSDEISSDWEEKLSDADKERLSSAREFVKRVE